jgi:hypothetical protein
VHRIKPDYQPEEAPPEATHLLVYRNRLDQVKFMQLNDVSRLLLELLQENHAASGLELLTSIAETIGHQEPETVISAGADLLNDLVQKDVLLGTRN